MRSSPRELTQMLVDASHGDQQALDTLMPLVYEELRRLARRHLQRERLDHTLQATALVHESYLRLMGQTDVRWESRAHFFGLAAEAMRRILVEHARRRGAAKRGGNGRPLTLAEVGGGPEAPGVDVNALDEALGRLAAFDPQKSRIVEMKFFGGLTHEEIAQVLGVTTRTVERGWRLATIALGSLYETRHWGRRAYLRGLLTREHASKLKPIISELGPRLNAYLRSIAHVPGKRMTND